jgi:ammonium transporter Rh
MEKINIDIPLLI